MGANKITLAAGVIGIDPSGAFTGSVIDFSDVTIDHTGSGGPNFIRAGTYGSPVSSSDAGQSGMIRLYGTNSATTDDESTGYYDRGIFVCLKTTGTKGAFPIAGLVEIGDSGANAGTDRIQAAQFIAHLNDTGAKLATLANSTGGMYGGWFKVTANEGATTASGSRAAPLWVDNQLYGSNIAAGMEEYGIFSTTGGSVPDAWAGFETTSSGWGQLFYFDETAYDQAPISGTALKVLLNSTQYYIPLSTSNASADTKDDINWNEGLTTNETYEGQTTTITVGESVVFGKVLVKKSDGEYYLTDADAVTTVPGQLMALESKGDGETCLCLVVGYACDTDWTWALGDGRANTLYCDDGTTGNMVQHASAPSDVGDQVNIVGRVVSTTCVHFKPTYELTEVGS